MVKQVPSAASSSSIPHDSNIFGIDRKLNQEEGDRV